MPHALKERIESKTNNPFPLGRHINHDLASVAYPAKRARSLRSVQHTHHGSVLDQGQIGSCTGHAIVDALMTTPDWNKNTTLDHASALALYERATVIDPWPGSYPPNDTGSDGISVCKAAVEKKLIVSYDHTFNFTDALLALVLKPVMFGTNWYDGMFTPTSTGEVKISGSIAGGHEWTAIGIDVKNAKIRAINSWGSSWGNNGYFYVSFPTLQRLLSENGDCTVPRTK